MSIKTEIRNKLVDVFKSINYFSSIVNYPFDNAVLETLTFPACIYEIREISCEWRNRLLSVNIIIEIEIWLYINEQKKLSYELADYVDSLLFSAIDKSLQDKSTGLGRYIQNFSRGGVNYLIPDNQYIVIQNSYNFSFLTKSSDLTTSIL